VTVVNGIVYVGSYDSGISIYARDGARLTLIEQVDAANPSFLARHPGGGVLYAVDELVDSTVTAYAIEGTGLRPLGRRPSGGAGPVHLLVHPAGYLVVANYGDGSVAVHALRPDGGLGALTDVVRHVGHGPHPVHQKSPHPHEVRLAGELIVVADLGIDKLIGYRLDPATGRLSVAADPFARTHPGAGPRGAAAHPTGRWYVSGELDSTLAVFDPDPSTGVLRQVAAPPATMSTVDDMNYPSTVVLSPDANRLYLANRGQDSLVTFAVDERGGLTPIDEVPTGGSWPRHFTVIEDILLVANQRAGTVVSFALDPATGLPRPTGDVVELATPACVVAG
jgi:6-phosphogluconolactonase